MYLLNIRTCIGPIVHEVATHAIAMRTKTPSCSYTVLGGFRDGLDRDSIVWAVCFELWILHLPKPKLSIIALVLVKVYCMVPISLFLSSAAFFNYTLDCIAMALSLSVSFKSACIQLLFISSMKAFLWLDRHVTCMAT